MNEGIHDAAPIMATGPTHAATGRRARSPTLAPPAGPLAQAYDNIRRFTETLCEPLETEDFVIQSMADASPTRWHLAHSTWFFETLILQASSSGYKPFHADFVYLFNSYYNTVGDPFPRPQRGLLSRPTVNQVYEYRAHVDLHMRRLLDDLDTNPAPEPVDLIRLGLNHEQQHQELILTDIKHVFSCNPLHPVYQEKATSNQEPPAPHGWMIHKPSLHWIGHDGDGFCYDNELPHHRVYIQPFQIADRLVTNAEFIRFIDDNGYRRHELWLSDGWSAVNQNAWTAPLYWLNRDGQWWNFTLSGMREVNPAEPVCHVSYFEADAYARWAGAYLPTEFAWEVAAQAAPMKGNFAEQRHSHPEPLHRKQGDTSLSQMFGDVWEWTASPYVAYPGFRPATGPTGEYNGKFMCNKFVVRGGSCATPCTHIRPTYRNFFPPDARWQFTGFRLAK